MSVAAAPRVLHVVESLDRGAVENWLMRMLRHARAAGVPVDWTFYSVLPRPGALDAEAEALGARVVHSPIPIGDKVHFTSALRAHMRAEGYDVLHGHHDLVSAVYLLAAAGLPLARRIVHVHNADEAVLTSNPVKAWAYREPARQVCLAMADRVVGISNHTLDTFLGGRARRPNRDMVHYYGVDVAPFDALRSDRSAFRMALGLPCDAKILLFAGRMAPEKNPLFTLDVLAAMRRSDPKVVGVFAGAGSLEEPIRLRALELGLGDAVRQLGWRDDVAAIMSVSDWFILPRPEHPMEGFGLAVVEAQLAGTRLLLSNGIPDDPLLPEGVYRRLPLAAGSMAWAAAAAALYDEPAPDAARTREALGHTPFGLDNALENLMLLHNVDIRGVRRAPRVAGLRN